MIIAIILFVFFAFLAYKTGSKNNTFLFYLLVVYSITFGFSFILSLIDVNQNVIIIPTLYLLLILFLWFIPFLSLGRDSINKLSFSKLLLKSLSITYGIILIPAFIIFTYYSAVLFMTRDISMFRVMSIVTGEYSLLPSNTIITILSHFSATYFIPLLLLFISLKENLPKKYLYVNLISSLSFPMLILSYAGRDGVMYWIIDIVFFYLLFKNLIHNDALKKLKKILFFGSAMLILPILIITFSRFVLTGMYGNQFQSIASYMGQQLGNFNESYFLDQPMKTTLFPGISKLIGLEQNKSDSYWILYDKGLESEYNVFGYFVKSLIWQLGKSGAIFFSLLFFLIVNTIKIIYNRNYNFLAFLLLLLLYHYPLMGVFYYRQGVGNMDLSYLISFILVYVVYIVLKIRK
jgi:hypothetical protein